MQCLVLYDISDDRARQRIADICLDYGLARIQFSAFSGVLTRTQQRALFTEITQRLGKRDGDVQLIAMETAVWQARRSIVQREDAHD